MNLENLEIGMIVKNYKAMCELVGEDVQGGNAKKAQIKEWNCHFKFRQQGYKFIIEEIYDEPLLKLDNRGKKSVYADILEVLLMDSLSRNNGKLIISKSKLTKELGLVNENYSLGYSNQSKMSTYLNIDIDYVKDFYNTSNSNLTGIIDNALKSLEKKCLIDVNTVTMVKYRYEEKPKIADEFDRAIIQEINRYCLEHFGMKELHFPKRDKTYHQFMEMRDLLFKQKTQIQHTYKAFDIVVNRKYIDKAKENLSKHIMTELERQGKLEELNELFSDNVISNAEKRHSNFTSSEKLLLIRFSESYIPFFKIMNHNLIKLQANKISLFGIEENALNKDQLDSISDLPF